MSRREPPPRRSRRAAPKVAPARRSRPTSAQRARRAEPSRRPEERRPTQRQAPRRTGAPPRARRQVEFRTPSTSPRRLHRAAPAAARKKRRVVAEQPEVRPPRDRLGLRQPAARLRMVLLVIVLALGYVLFKVGTIQSSDGEQYREAAADLWQRSRDLPADRGTIFDRDGEELALSIPGFDVSVNPKLITNPEATARMLQGAVGLTDGETRELYDELVAQDRGFVYVKRQIDRETGEMLQGLGINGLNVDAADIRVLPGGTVGWSVIGRTDIDGVGISGLEDQYDEMLTGTPGELRKEVAPGGRSVVGTEEIVAPPVPGNDLILTLDRSIQFQAEQLLTARVDELLAKSGTVIVLDTDTGDVLAMASVLRNDDDVVEVTSGNFAAVNAYEPGSVAKVITIAAGLNEGTVTPETEFVVPWRRQYADNLLRDSHEHPDELLTVEQILVKSSNIGTIDVWETIGAGDWDTSSRVEGTAREVHWNYLRDFGLGERTALDFPGESAGILKDWTDLWGSERVTVSYGQGMASTSIQLAAAVNTIANDGTYVAPRLVLGTVDADGEVMSAPPSATHEVVSTETAETVQAMMHQVVCRGTGKRAQQGITGFSVAGKTGTGLKAQPNGTYLNEEGQRVYYASFVGFFPAEDPQVTVLVSIDEPPAGDINRFGGTAAAPVFADLAPTIVHERGIQPATDAAPCAES